MTLKENGQVSANLNTQNKTSFSPRVKKTYMHTVFEHVTAYI